MNSKPRCTLICVGSELLRGKLNTHASYISRKLPSIGLSLDEETTVGDREIEITQAIRRALDVFDVVIVSGGLGPTFDDLTREAASHACDHPLVRSDKIIRELKAKFRLAHYRMPQANARQADVLEGARVIANRVGTAPGQWLDLGTRILILLPGPPSELYPMLEHFVLPHLEKRFPSRAHAEAHLHFIGVPESFVDQKIRPIIAKHAHGKERVQFTILAHLALVDFDVFVSSESAPRARKTLENITRSIKKAMGDAFYGADEAYPLEKVVGDLLRRRRATLATAESCTGGLLAARLTDLAGSSDYFLEGCVTYSNSAKMRGLGVPESLLRKHGAVSKPVALAMAQGVRQRGESTYGIGITGIAGPGGGTSQKPVGLVYIALASKSSAICKELHFRGSRDAIRQRAVLAALDLLRKGQKQLVKQGAFR
jgi:nicotinamide-nucleotide amidase